MANSIMPREDYNKLIPWHLIDQRTASEVWGEEEGTKIFYETVYDYTIRDDVLNEYFHKLGHLVKKYSSLVGKYEDYKYLSAAEIKSEFAKIEKRFKDDLEEAVNDIIADYENGEYG